MSFFRRMKRWMYPLSGAVLALLVSCPLVFAGHIRVVTAEEPPANYTRNGEVTGIVTDIVKAVLASLNQTVEIEMLPWARAYQISLVEPNVAIFTAGKTQERIDHGYHFIGPVTTRKHSLYKMAGNPLKIFNIDDIIRTKLRVGALRGDWRGKFFMDQGVEVASTTNYIQLVEMLLHDRIDLCILSDLELGENLKIAGVDREQIDLAYVFQERDAYIMLSKDTSPQIVTQWENALTVLQSTDFFTRTSRKWSGILGFEVHYAVDKGFYAE